LKSVRKRKWYLKLKAGMDC